MKKYRAEDFAPELKKDFTPYFITIFLSLFIIIFVVIINSFTFEDLPASPNPLAKYIDGLENKTPTAADALPAFNQCMSNQGMCMQRCSRIKEMEERFACINDCSAQTQKCIAQTGN